MYLIEQAADLIRSLTGITPDTTYWDKHSDYMINTMALTPAEVLAAVKLACGDPWHKPKVMDKGLAHIRYNYHQIIQKLGFTRTAHVRSVEREVEMYKLGKHQRWDVETHIFIADYKKEYGEMPGRQALHAFTDNWYANNLAIANEWADCPICQEEIAAKLLNGREIKPLDTRRLIKDFVGALA